jgi:uncharacterized protein DUF262
MKSSAQATNRKISWFAREQEADTLDLSPAFQRRPVWRDDQASYLIDTILNGLPFPEIYVRAQTTPEGRTTYEVVDGQQRIRSILNFARDDLVLTGSDVSPTFQGKSFSDLAPSEKTTFWNYDVVTRDLYDASDGDIRDLFRRLNIGAVTLNDQELRHAKYTGEFITLMEIIADDEWWTDSRVVNVRQVRRMEDVEYISELFIALMAGPQDKKTTLDNFYEDFDLAFPEKDLWNDRFTETRSLMESILEPAEIRAWSGKSDFYSLFTSLGSYIEEGKKFTPKARARVRAALGKFRSQVNQAKRRDNTKTFPQYVHDYADAVTRAATDAARRKLRFDILRTVIDGARKKA